MNEPRISGLDHLVLTVADADRSIAFYQTGLGMTPERFAGADGTQRLALRFGSQKINLHVAGKEFEPRATTPVPGSADLCFLTETPLADWQAHWAAQGIRPESGPVPRTGATGPLISVYLRDPDGNLIEVANRG